MAVWLGLSLFSFACLALYARHSATNGKQLGRGRVAVIVPVKSAVDDDLRPFLESLSEQTYQDWYVIFAVASTDDPSCEVVSGFLKSGRVSGEVVTAGLATLQGQKIQNLLAGVDRIRDCTDYLAFCDADSVLPRNFVGRLVHPLARDRCDISTCYRLIMPCDSLLGSLLVAVANLQVAFFPRYGRWTVPWGGGTAMRLATFDRLQVRDAWEGYLSDDLRLARIAWAQGARVKLQRDLLIPSRLSSTVMDALRFGIRQYQHVFTNSVVLWFFATAVLSIHAAGWIWLFSQTVRAGIGAMVSVWVFMYVLSIGRNIIRALLLYRLQGMAAVKPMRLALLMDSVFPFLAPGLHCAVALAASVCPRITWGGCEYWVRGGKVVRLRRLAK